MNYIYENNKCYKMITCPKCGYNNKYKINLTNTKIPWYVCERCNHIIKPKSTVCI
jgi:transposase-like protein